MKPREMDLRMADWMVEICSSIYPRSAAKKELLDKDL